MAKVIKQIQLSTNTIVNSKQAAQRELSNVMANNHYIEMLLEMSQCKNNSALSLVIDKYKDRLTKYIALMYEAEEIQTLNI